MDSSTETKLAVLQNDISYIKEKIRTVDDKVSNSYVTKEEFDAKFGPVQKIVYGLVGVILLAVFGAIINIVVTK